VMHQAVYGGERHRGLRKYLIPAGERLICRQRQTLPFIAGRDQLEQYRGFSLVASNIAQVVQYQQVKGNRPINTVCPSAP
jgi:hypothetical protein